MDLSGGQVSCQTCTCLSSLTLYLELCAGSCVGHMPHSPTPPAHEPTAAEKVPWRLEARGRAFFSFFFFTSGAHCVESLQISLSFCLSLALSYSVPSYRKLFLHTWIPVGVCNSKHSLGKMLVAAPSPHGLTGPIPPALRPREQSHMTSNILICGLGCISSNKKPFFVVDLLFCSTLLPNQQIYFTFPHF